MFPEMYQCRFLFFIMTEESWSLKVGFCIWAKSWQLSYFLNSPGLWHGSRAILSTASQTYIISQCLINCITHWIQINSRCQSMLVYSSPCCHCCSSALSLDFCVQLYVHPHFVSFPAHEWVMKAFLFLNLAALLHTDSCVKALREKMKSGSVSLLVFFSFFFFFFFFNVYICAIHNYLIIWTKSFIYAEVMHWVD